MWKIHAWILLVALLITRMSIRSSWRKVPFAAVVAAAFPSSHTHSLFSTRSFPTLAPRVTSIAPWNRQIKRTMATKNQDVTPRAAVSVVVRVSCTIHEGRDKKTGIKFYLLIQRGTEPNKGIWSLPGGKIDYGESTLQAAQRELHEETQWSNPSVNSFSDSTTMLSNLRWWDETVTTTDAIGEGYHYLIAHCFAEYPPIEIRRNQPLEDLSSSLAFCQKELPRVHGSDDAADAQWLTFSQIQEMESIHRNVTSGILRVIQRVEGLDAATSVMI
jgi:8-oxo-dGTP pyrophosphatase MutT (NUDIX family)